MFTTLQNVYFIGIGGIGMSALARWFKAKNFQVFGYDKTPSDLTRSLEAEGIFIHYEDNSLLIPTTISEASKDKTLVIFTPAVPSDHQELNYFHQNNYLVKKRAEVLGMISNTRFNIAIAGTHGKTTTTSMVAHILTFAQKPCTAFNGGILLNYQTNMLISQAKEQEEIIVAEADEYDRSFLQLNPDLAVITSVEADHLDIYQDAQAVLETYALFAAKVKPSGCLVAKPDTLQALQKFAQINCCFTYGVETPADYQALHVKTEQGQFVFDIQPPNHPPVHVTLQVPGQHNVENATAAFALTHQAGVEPATIAKALSQYKGVKRRFEFIVREEDRVYIDDYAHHPTEIKVTIEAARALFPQKKLTVVFQPHLFSRTRDFLNEFAQSLSLADEVILLEIYPAREAPIAGVDSSLLLNQITTPSKQLCEKSDLIATIEQLQPELLITMGAGDIDRFVSPLQKILGQHVA